MSGSWANADGLLLQFGTQKAAQEQGGDFLSYGERREVELRVDLTSLTTTPVLQSLTTFLPAGTNVMVEEVDLYTDVSATGGTALSVGLGYIATSYTGTYTTVTQFGNVLSLPAVTSISSTALVNTLVVASISTAGTAVSLTGGANSVGSVIGTYSTNTTQPNYITAFCGSGTGFTAGQVRVRIKYRGIGTISQ